MSPRLLVLVVSVVLAISAPTPGSAAMWMRIEVRPQSVLVGETVRVSVQTLALYGANCLDDPAAQVEPVVAYDGSSGPPLDAMALRASHIASGDAFEFSVERRPSDGTWWDAGVIFPSAGE